MCMCYALRHVLDLCTIYICKEQAVGSCFFNKNSEANFKRAKLAVPFQIKYIIQKNIYQPLGPQNTPLVESWEWKLGLG